MMILKGRKLMKSYEERTKWFNEVRFGMIIHWGLYSILGRGEWVMYFERIPKEEYAKLADKFNPTKFNADSWVRLAKSAGMKKMVFTTRHHDGFCLFDSKVSDFTSVKTAAKRDFVAEYVSACRKYGMKIGFYYSLLDWRFPGYHLGPEKGPKNFNEMVEQAHAQVKELMTNYGKIDYLVYDGDWIPGVKFTREWMVGQGEQPETAKYWRSVELNSMVRKLQPDIFINNRSGLNEDVDTPEQAITPSKPGRLWESSMTIGDLCAWGYVKNDRNLKTTLQLIEYLVSTASAGGNYLLNVGPKPDGTIQDEFVARLKQIGNWIKINGESIYGSERVPAGINAGLLGTTTAKSNILYLHIFRWPGTVARITGIKNKIISAKILSTGKKVEFNQPGNGIVILEKLPGRAIDKYDTVIKLELDGKPEAYPYDGIAL